ncbi:hypothetical protein FACS1894187_21840 [Synergistales bacterium]|nr:hypothetical protein FACS1894187_21840 [Synergistales bacterium]
MKLNANKFDAKKSEVKKFDAKDGGARRYDARDASKSERQPFESVLNQASTETPSLDNRLSAQGRGDNSPAEKAEVSDISNISNALSDLLSPLSAEQNGSADLSSLATQMSLAMEEFLATRQESGSDVGEQNQNIDNSGDFGIDAVRLESTLAAMKNRHPIEISDASAVSEESPQSLDRAAIIDLTASFLKNLQNSRVQKHKPSDTPEIPTENLDNEPLPNSGAPILNPLLDVFDDNDEALNQGDAQVQFVSRFSAYLKDNFTDAKTALTEKTGKFASIDARSSALKDSDVLSAAVIQAAAGAASEGKQNDSESDSSNSRGDNLRASDTPLLNQPDSTGSKKEVSPSALQDKPKGYEDAALKAEDDNVSAPRGADTRLDRSVNFEQFLNSVARRESDVAPLELSHGRSLSRNEALREGLDNVVRFARVNGEQKASMIIDPPALGRIIVELNATSAGLEASIKVSSEQVRQLIQEEMSQLRYSLAQQGVELTNFSVDVQQDSGQRNRDDGQQGGRQRILAADDEQDEDANFRVDLNQGLLYWVA